MNIRYLLPFAVLVGGAAHSAPLANLVLSCPDESAIDQPFDACHGYIYEIPTNERIVVSSSYVWRKAADLAPSDLLMVCTIPVEPGAYSSCRDSAGIRRTAFVPKDSVITGGRNSVIVSKTGGDYTDPVTAAQNAFAGDTWCVSPQWPLQPCVMAIGSGVFILPATLSILEGLAVSGNGKGTTMLVADNGVETAVTSFGNVRISDLTIVNSQPGQARAVGLFMGPNNRDLLVQLHDMAIHVAGAGSASATCADERCSAAVIRNTSVEVLDSEITAVGPAATGFRALVPDVTNTATLERSYVAAEVAFHEPQDRPFTLMRLVDSHVFGTIRFNLESGRLEIVGSEIVGIVSANNDGGHVVITDSSIKGSVGVGHAFSSPFPAHLEMTNTNVEGNVGIAGGGGTFDGVRVNGRLGLTNAVASVLGSYIIDSTGTAATLNVLSSAVHLQQTFVEGTQAVVLSSAQGFSSEGRLEASSSVLAGPVSRSANSVLSCIDTYGADYELLSATCQPQTP